MRPLIRSLLLCLLLGLPTVNARKLVPEAPVIDFRLPMFSESGFKSWEVIGHEGRYLGEDVINVLILQLRLYSGERDRELRSTISSPEAMINLREKLASGEGVLRVVAEGYRVRGKDWTWDGKTRNIVIRKEVTVEFDGTLGQIL